MTKKEDIRAIKKHEAIVEQVRPPVSANVVEKMFSPNIEKHGGSEDSEDVSMIIREWLSKAHITRKTRYNKRQVVAVSILQSLANTYKIRTLDRFLNEFRTSKLSEDGKSSSELEGILKARMPQEEDLELKKLSRFLE